MARTLDQINAELDKFYSPDRGIYQQQLDALPGQSTAEIAGLDAKLTQANDSILNGARARGLGFSGIPIAEQAQYAATDYAPAVARVKQQQESSRLGIMQALSGLERDRRSQAQGIFDNERNFEEQQRQFNEQLAWQKQQFAEQQAAAARAAAASQSAGIGAYLGGGGSASAPAQKSGNPSYGRNSAGGFWFKDGSGKPIGAYTYSQLAGVDYNDIIRKMAATGDDGAFKYLSDRNGYAGKGYATNAKLNQQMLSRYNLW